MPEATYQDRIQDSPSRPFVLINSFTPKPGKIDELANLLEAARNRFADRGARHTAVLGELVFRHELPGREVPRKDPGAYADIGFVRGFGHVLSDQLRRGRCAAPPPPPLVRTKRPLPRRSAAARPAR